MSLKLFRQLFCSGLLFLPLILTAQDWSGSPNDKPKGWFSDFHWGEFRSGVLFYDNPILPDSIWSGNTKYHVTAGTGGGGTLFLARPRCGFIGHVSGNFVLPIKSKSDSLESKLWAWRLGAGIGVDFLSRKKNMDLNLTIGANWGYYHLSITKDSKEKFYNPYFAPKVSLDYRIVVWKIAIGIHSEYQFDVSKSTWKTESIMALPGSRFSGILIQGTVGVGLYRNRKSN